MLTCIHTEQHRPQDGAEYQRCYWRDLTSALWSIPVEVSQTYGAFSCLTALYYLHAVCILEFLFLTCLPLPGKAHMGEHKPGGTRKLAQRVESVSVFSVCRLCVQALEAPGCVEPRCSLSWYSVHFGRFKTVVVCIIISFLYSSRFPFLCSVCPTLIVTLWHFYETTVAVLLHHLQLLFLSSASVKIVKRI